MSFMVADVIKSFDTVERSILDCALGRLGLLPWFRKVFSLILIGSGSGFKLAARDGVCSSGLLPEYGFYCCRVRALV